jgi:hypothetical protein
MIHETMNLRNMEKNRGISPKREKFGDILRLKVK